MQMGRASHGGAAGPPWADTWWRGLATGGHVLLQSILKALEKALGDAALVAGACGTGLGPVLGVLPVPALQGVSARRAHSAQ